MNLPSTSKSPSERTYLGSRSFLHNEHTVRGHSTPLSLQKSTGIVRWRLSLIHCILTLVFATADSTARFSIVDFVFQWILVYTEWCPEPAQLARMGAWKPKMCRCRCRSTMFHWKRLGWYYRWHVDWPLPSTWTPRWKYLLHFIRNCFAGSDSWRSSRYTPKHLVLAWWSACPL